MFGHILIIFGLVSGIVSLSMYYFTYNNYENTLKIAQNAYKIQFTFILLASALLVKSIISHDFSNSYVYEYSSTTLSPGLLLSSFFAGQQGSFLLWLLFSSVIGLFLQKRLKNDARYESSVMIFYLLSILFLNVLVLPGLKDPFASLFTGTNYISVNAINKSFLSIPQIQNFIFTNGTDPSKFVKIGAELKATILSLGIEPSEFIAEGKGLNPLLQNFWMEIHPPILFLGFAFTAVPFSFALAALLRNEYKTWIKYSLPWLLIGMAILGAGIMLGGYWAYGVLGWGGYWGWDPVENSSLVPWIVGMALIHTMIIQNRFQNSEGVMKYLRTNLVLAVITFVMVIYSTFLTRSGILSDASVHSFVEPGMLTYAALVGFMVGFVVIGAVLLYKRWNSISSFGSPINGWLNRENALFYGSALLLGMSIIITVGTSSPIFGTSVKIDYYNIMNKPLAILAGIILGFSLFLGWGKTSKRIILKQALVSFGISFVISSLVFYFSGLTGIQNYLFLLGAFFGLVTNLFFFTKNVRNSIAFTGGQLAHLGLAVMLMGIVLNGNLVTKHQTNLPKGKRVSVGNFSVKYIGYSYLEESKKFKFDVEFSNKDNSFIASPLMYKSDYNGSTMKEPYIKEGFKRDIYISPMGLESEKGGDSKQVLIKKGEIKHIEGFNVKFVKFDFTKKDMSNMTAGKNFKIFAELELEKDGRIIKAKPLMTSEKGKNFYVADTLKTAGLAVKMVKMDASGSVLVTISKIGTKIQYKPETLSAEISFEPFIALVWIGVILITIGLLLAGFNRFKLNKIRG